MTLDMYDFMTMVADTLAQCESDEQIESIAKKMIEIIQSSERMSKEYLKAGIL